MIVVIVVIHLSHSCHSAGRKIVLLNVETYLSVKKKKKKKKSPKLISTKNYVMSRLLADK